jgi:hypothetical protein
MSGMRISCSIHGPFISIVLLAGQACLGQSVSIGVKAGGRLTDDMSSIGAATSESKRYIVGPTLEFGLPLGLSVEVDAMYQRQGYQASFSGPIGGSTDWVRANAWEVPVLARYKLPIPILKPYVEAGVAPRLMSGASDSSIYSSMDIPTGVVTYGHSHGAANWPDSVGTVMGAGVQFGFGSLRLAPEVRYTRWNSTPINESGSYGYEFHSAQNQVDLLLGVSWKVR